MTENRTAAEQRDAAGHRSATDSAPGDAVAATDPGRGSAAARDVGGGSTADAPTASLPVAAGPRETADSSSLRPATTGGSARIGATPLEDPPPAPYAAVPRRPARSERQEARTTSGTGVRRAQLALRRIDPWSVFVLSLLVSLFLGIVLLVAVGLLFLLLQSAGVISSVDKFARELSLISQDASVLTGGRVMTVAAIVAAVDVVVLTVLATLGAVLYNVCASFTGGIEVTLAERE